MPCSCTSRRRSPVAMVCHGSTRASAGFRQRPRGYARVAPTSGWKSMFTGLIEAIGEVSDMQPAPAGFRLRLRTAMAPELSAGESIAVNGVCLTVVEADGDGFSADVSPE